MKRPKVSVVVPVHGHPGVTKRCLDAVLATAPEAELIVVDDGSPSGMGKALSPLDGRVVLVHYRTPRGYATACNDGATAASAPLIAFLNNDTVAQPGWLDRLVDAAEAHPEAAAFGSRLVYPDRTIQHAGVVVCGDRLPRHVYRGFPSDHPAVLRSRPFQIVTAACMLVGRKAFEAAEGFDSAFRNGLEDVDLCLRLRERGHEVRYCAESVLVHLESVSLAAIPKGERAAEIAGNLTLYRERWASRVEPDDLRTYSEDGLISFDYAHDGRPRACISPLLAELDSGLRTAELEQLARRRERQVAELLEDLVDLTVALADDELAAWAKHAVGALPTRRLAYRALRRRIHDSVERTIPRGARVLVAARGDDELVELEGVDAQHFPQGARGVYAGHHPPTAADAIDELEAQRRRGASFFVLPETMRWWLEHYDAFARHLERYPKVRGADGCEVYALEER